VDGGLYSNNSKRRPSAKGRVSPNECQIRAASQAAMADETEASDSSRVLALPAGLWHLTSHGLRDEPVPDALNQARLRSGALSLGGARPA